MRSRVEVTNPANSRETSVTDGTRIPMSVPETKLTVPEIPGYHLHWMLGNPQRIQQALRAGYTFVEQDEIYAVNTGVANNAAESGSTDLGTRVSVPAGVNDLDPLGNPQSLYLMKIKQEWWDADQAKIAEKNELVARTLRGEGLKLENGYIPEHAKKPMGDLFVPKTPKRST